MKKTAKALIILSLPLFIASCEARPIENNSDSFQSSSFDARSLREGEIALNGIIYTFCENPPSYNVSSFDHKAGLTDVTLPSEIEGKPVRHISENAFHGCESLTSIKIPQSVLSIEQGAFTGCTSLTSVEIPSSVTSIGINSFWGCTMLPSITIPDSVKELGKNSFYCCYSLSSVKLPSGLTEIGHGFFEMCSSLTSVDLPRGVTSIGDCAFDDCYSLESIDIPSGVTSIGNQAFMGCLELSSITLPRSVKEIGRYALYCVSSLTYLGTKAEWQDVTKGEYFVDSETISVVHCSDGDLNI